jgi:hypothetical protein
VGKQDRQDSKRDVARWTLLVVAALTACSPQRTLEALWVLGDVQAGDSATYLKSHAPPPTRAPIRIGGAAGEMEADLYMPGELALAGIVLVPGLAPKGRDDPRLVAFANTLARARFAVLVPDLPNMRRQLVTHRDAVLIADAAANLQEYGHGWPVGLIAVSFAVGPAVLSLLEPTAHDRVAFVVAIGGYYDIQALITYVTTGYYRRAGEHQWRHLEPNPYAPWVFLLINARRLDNANDRRMLMDIATRKLDDPKASVDDLSAALGPEGRAVYALMTNADPERTPELIGDLPAGVRAGIEALDLKRQPLCATTARFILIHDRNDRVIPVTQSEDFALALGEERAKIYIVASLSHADISPLGVFDAFDLLGATYTVLALRDGIIVRSASKQSVDRCRPLD